MKNVFPEQAPALAPRDAVQRRGAVPRRRVLSALGAAAAALALPSLAAGPLPRIDVYKSPDCGCCGAWVEHLKAAGFPVQVVDVGDTTVVRKRHGLADRFGSCHTGIVDGYVVEGHVPAVEVKRLLALRPQAIGLAVPGMPPGSPGMEVPGRNDPYDVFLVDRNGRETVFAHYPKSSRGRA